MHKQLTVRFHHVVPYLQKSHSETYRRTYVKEVKNCRLAIRHFRHVKKRAKAKKALTRLRTVAYRLFDGFVSVAISMAYGNI
jgi:IS5 family transposase